MTRVSLNKLYPLLFAVLLGCQSENMAYPVSAGDFDYLSYLKSLNKVRVEYIAKTVHHSFVKQGVLDPGADLYLTYVREYSFANLDSTYEIEWQDSLFTTRACFKLREIEPPGVEEKQCSTNSIARGVFHNHTMSISDILCAYQQFGGSGQDYSYFYTSFRTPTIMLDSLFEDSVTFVIKNPLADSTILSYSIDEQAYGTYIRQENLVNSDSLRSSYPRVCRVVFYKK
jgi:hypothetical protein